MNITVRLVFLGIYGERTAEFSFDTNIKVSALCEKIFERFNLVPRGNIVYYKVEGIWNTEKSKRGVPGTTFHGR